MVLSLYPARNRKKRCRENQPRSSPSTIPTPLPAPRISPSSTSIRRRQCVGCLPPPKRRPPLFPHSRSPPSTGCQPPPFTGCRPSTSPRRPPTSQSPATSFHRASAASVARPPPSPPFTTRRVPDFPLSASAAQTTNLASSPCCVIPCTSSDHD